MKKSISILLVLVMMVSLVACSKEKETTDNEIVIEVGESSKFSDDEIKSAIALVEEDFDFEGASLKKLWYDEEKSNSMVDDYLESGKGSEKSVTEDNVIVILSRFDVDKDSENPVLNPGETYDDYNWILIRNDEDSKWEIDETLWHFGHKFGIA